MSNLSLEVKRLYKLNGDSKLKAFADIAINGVFLIKGLRIVDSKNGLFVAMPRSQGKDGKWYPTVYSLSDEVAGQLNEVVLSAYQSE